MRSLLFLAVLAGTAHADPLVSVSLDSATSDQVFAQITETHEDPGGLLARADIPELGLKAGDVIRSINGAVPSTLFRFGGTLLFLDVVRGKQTFVVHVAVKPENHERPLDRDGYTSMVDRLRSNEALVQLTKKNAASGVVLRRPLFELGEEGDVIRAVDGAATNTIDAVLEALDRAHAHSKVVVKLERRGEPYTVTFSLSDPAPDPEISKIKKTGDTSYEIPRAVIDAILGNPMSIAKGARVVPAVKDGKADGFKLYAVRPSSIFAALGLANGDLLQSVNGQPLTSADKALEIYTSIHDASKLVVGIRRRDKTLTFTYTIK